MTSVSMVQKQEWLYQIAKRNGRELIWQISNFPSQLPNQRPLSMLANTVQTMQPTQVIKLNGNTCNKTLDTSLITVSTVNCQITCNTCQIGFSLFLRYLGLCRMHSYLVKELLYRYIVCTGLVNFGRGSNLVVKVAIANLPNSFPGNTSGYLVQPSLFIYCRN